jgi:hypothetical protein
MLQDFKAGDIGFEDDFVSDKRLPPFLFFSSKRMRYHLTSQYGKSGRYTPGIKDLTGSEKQLVKKSGSSFRRMTLIFINFMPV